MTRRAKAKGKTRTRVWLILGTDNSNVQRPFWHRENAEEEWRRYYGGENGGCKVKSAILEYTEPRARS